MLNILTVDVEDFFHPTEVQRHFSADPWDAVPGRVVEPTRRILRLLDAHGAKATFFLLGWVARRYPELVREIAAAGHDLGCHSFRHPLIYDLTPASFRRDTEEACQAVSDACGLRPRAYRAPSYSITERSFWALEILIELGFTHDSSIYPISHHRYGIPGFRRDAHVIETPSGPIVEVPAATVRLSGNLVAPVGGGAYLRLFPYCYTAAGIRRINEDESRPACIYFHPWELDPEVPRLPLGLLGRLRTYTGLAGMAAKIERLCQEFRFSTLESVHPFPMTHTV